jgi:3-phenylpropionate/cinnamic acid dioxygenase small subunit
MAVRLSRLEDERAILDTLYRYSQAIDETAWADQRAKAAEAAWIDCFVEDGVFAWKPRAEDDWAIRLEGRVALTRFIQRAAFPAGVHENHTLVNPRVTSLDGGRAEAYCYYVILKGTHEDVWVNTTGRYSDQLVRCPDGRWRLTERLAVGDFVREATSPLAGTRAAASG